MKTLPNKENVNELATFVKRLFFTVSGFSIAGLGGFAAWIGLYETSMLIKEVALVTSGVCAFSDGMYVVYKALMRK